MLWPHLDILKQLSNPLLLHCIFKVIKMDYIIC
jgi:hypothetical protein